MSYLLFTYNWLHNNRYLNPYIFILHFNYLIYTRYSKTYGTNLNSRYQYSKQRLFQEKVKVQNVIVFEISNSNIEGLWKISYFPHYLRSANYGSICLHHRSSDISEHCEIAPTIWDASHIQKWQICAGCMVRLTAMLDWLRDCTDKHIADNPRVFDRVRKSLLRLAYRVNISNNYHKSNSVIQFIS